MTPAPVRRWILAGYRSGMDKYLKYALTTSLASTGAITAGAFVIESNLLLAAWGAVILVSHFAALVVLAARELAAEFGVRPGAQ